MASQIEQLDIRVILTGQDACKFIDLQKHFGDKFSTEAFRKIVRSLHEKIFDVQHVAASSRDAREGLTSSEEQSV